MPHLHCFAQPLYIQYTRSAVKRDKQSIQNMSAYHFICQDAIEIVVIQAKKPSQALHINYGISAQQNQYGRHSTGSTFLPCTTCKGSRSATLSATLPLSGLSLECLT